MNPMIKSNGGAMTTVMMTATTPTGEFQFSLYNVANPSNIIPTTTITSITLKKLSIINF
jgi:hypothetical protein